MNNRQMSTAQHFPVDALAPWADVVPNAGSVGVDLLLALPDDGYRYEVVEGTLVRVAGSGDEATTLGVELAAELRNYVRPRRLGRVTGADRVHRFPGTETGLIPYVGFYRAERRSMVIDRSKPLPFAPDLAIEVASPSQAAGEIEAKARLYLRGGTRLVWIVWPQEQQIEVWRAGILMAPAVTLHSGDMLDGEDVIPGFSYPVAEVFIDPLG